MAGVLWPLWTRWCQIGYWISSQSCSPRAVAHFRLLTPFLGSIRHPHFRSHALKLRETSPAADDDDDGERRSKNNKKKEAKRAVRWGMELAAFSPQQIKRILSVAALDEQVFDALMLVKRLGRDVREGRRRQFSYIGGLLREMEPDIMEGLIQATKDGDLSKFQSLSGSETLIFDNAEEDTVEEIEAYDEEDSETADILSRWCDGLISKDPLITNEVYALQEVEFDRQKLRQLVRAAQSPFPREGDDDMEEGRNQNGGAQSARKFLTLFLRGIVKQLPSQQ